MIWYLAVCKSYVPNENTKHFSINSEYIRIVVLIICLLFFSLPLNFVDKHWSQSTHIQRRSFC